MSELLDYNKQAEVGDFALTVNERDAIGEIGNICMGTAATTLSTLLGNTVSITTPRVGVGRIGQEMNDREGHYVSVEVSYVQGIEGSSVLLIKERDVFIITSILMGEPYDDDADVELDDMHFSAISEVMNQMMGSSATAMSDIVKEPVSISPPVLHQTTLDDYKQKHHKTTINTKFSMEIENVLQTEIIQIMPFDFGKKLSSCLLMEVMGTAEDEPAPAMQSEGSKADESMPEKKAEHASRQPAQQPAPKPLRSQEKEPSRIGVRSVRYQSFDAASGTARAGEAESGENIDFIMDVPLQVKVELGQCRKTIKDILGMSMGSVIVLDKLAGEMVDIFVNNKLFARGEVVVIDDNYGVRITDIVAEPKL